MKKETIEKKDRRLKEEIEIDIFDMPDDLVNQEDKKVRDYRIKTERNMTEALRLLQEDIRKKEGRLMRVVIVGFGVLLLVGIVFFINHSTM